MLSKSDAALHGSREPGTATLYRAALTGLASFVAIVGAEHLLNTSLDPLEHQVSEYVHTASGALVVVGFASWGFSLAATALLMLRFRERLLAALFAVAALGMAFVALFPTQTIAGELPPGASLTLTGRLHDLGSGLTTIGLLGTAIWGLAGGEHPRSLRITAAILILSAAVLSVVLLGVGPAVGGLRQRLLLLIGCFWQFAFLRSNLAGTRVGDR